MNIPEETRVRKDLMQKPTKEEDTMLHTAKVRESEAGIPEPPANFGETMLVLPADQAIHTHAPWDALASAGQSPRNCCTALASSTTFEYGSGPVSAVFFSNTHSRLLRRATICFECGGRILPLASRRCAVWRATPVNWSGASWSATSRNTVASAKPDWILNATLD